MKVVKSQAATVPVNSIRPHPRNPRRGDVYAIGKSIEAHGFYGRVLVQKSTGYILVGNHRYFAAVEADAAEIPVEYVDVPDDEALRILLDDNRASDMAQYDHEILRTAMAEAGPSAISEFFDPSVIDPAEAVPYEPEAVYPISATFGERYNYAVVFTENESDWVHLVELLGIVAEKSYKNSAVKPGHVLRFADFLKRVEAYCASRSRDPKPQASGKGKDVGPDPVRKSVRPRKPS
jgi:hypothetical protein